MPELIETKPENNYYVPMGLFFQVMAEASAVEEKANLAVPLKTEQEKEGDQRKGQGNQEKD